MLVSTIFTQNCIFRWPVARYPAGQQPFNCGRLNFPDSFIFKLDQKLRSTARIPRFADCGGGSNLMNIKLLRSRVETIHTSDNRRSIKRKRKITSCKWNCYFLRRIQSIVSLFIVGELKLPQLLHGVWKGCLRGKIQTEFVLSPFITTRTPNTIAARIKTP